MMVLDQCIPSTAPHDQAEAARGTIAGDVGGPSRGNQERNRERVRTVAGSDNVENAGSSAIERRGGVADCRRRGDFYQPDLVAWCERHWVLTGFERRADYRHAGRYAGCGAHIVG